MIDEYRRWSNRQHVAAPSKRLDLVKKRLNLEYASFRLTNK